MGFLSVCIKVHKTYVEMVQGQFALLVGTQSCRDVGDYSVKESFGGSLMQCFPKIFDCSLFDSLFDCSLFNATYIK